MTAKQIKLTTDEKLLEKFIAYVNQCAKTPREFYSTLPGMLDRQDLAKQRLQAIRLTKNQSA